MTVVQETDVDTTKPKDAKPTYSYRVLSLQNDIEPAVGTYITDREVVDLIRRNITVNVKGDK